MRDIDVSVAGCACAAGRRCACAQAAHPGEEVERVDGSEPSGPHTLVAVQAGRTGAERLVAPQLERLDVCRELHILHRLTVAESWRAPRGVTSRGADQCRPPSRLVQSREVCGSKPLSGVGSAASAGRLQACSRRGGTVLAAPEPGPILLVAAVAGKSSYMARAVAQALQREAKCSPPGWIA